MGHPPGSRRIKLVIRALLTLLCVFAVPKLASSEADSAADQDAVSSKQLKAKIVAFVCGKQRLRNGEARHLASARHGDLFGLT
jgi:hypothetical protein